MDMFIEQMREFFHNVYNMSNYYNVYFKYFTILYVNHPSIKLKLKIKTNKGLGQKWYSGPRADWWLLKPQDCAKSPRTT